MVNSGRQHGLLRRAAGAFVILFMLAYSDFGRAQASAGTSDLSASEEANQPAQLGTVTVEGQTETGYVPEFSDSATKTDTPLIETPQSVSVINETRIETQNIDNLGEALRYTPGIQGEPFGFEPRFTFLRIRGFDASTTGLYRNGLQLRNPDFAISYGLEPYGAERIDVLRGPVSVLFGAGSPGGLVNYVSKRPTARPLREVGVELGNFDHVGGKFDLGGPIDEAGNFSYRLTGLTRESNTQVDFINDDRLFIAPALTWRPDSQTRLTLLGHFQDDDTRSSQALPAAGTLKPNPNGTIPVDRFAGEPAIDRYERTDYSLGYEFEHHFNDAWTFRQNMSYYGNELNDVSVYSNTVSPDMRTVNRAFFESFGDLDGLALDNHLQAEFATGPVHHTMLFGVDYQHVELSSLQTFGAGPSIDIFNPVYGAPVPPAPVFNDSDTMQEQTGFYIQDQIKFHDKWILTLAGRYDDATTESQNNLTTTGSKQDDSDFTTRFGLMYVSDIGLSPYFSYAESFLPSIGTDAAGNEFEPETGKQYEIGIKFQPRGTNSYMTAALFDLTRENFTETDPATFLPVQTGEIRSRGLELEGVASFDFGLDLIASYTYLDMEIMESVRAGEIGERPTQTPRQMASIWADYAFQSPALLGFHLGAGVRYVGSSYGDLPNTLKVPGETLVDVAAHYDLDNIQFRLNVKNLFDKEYVASAFTRSGSEFATYGQTRTIVGSILYRW